MLADPCLLQWFQIGSCLKPHPLCHQPQQKSVCPPQFQPQDSSPRTKW